MPSTSRKQHNLMAAVANNPKFAKKVGIPQSVGKDFVKADEGRKFSRGGDMKESKAMMAKEVGFMKKKLTSAKTANDPNSRINKSLRAWKC